MTIQTWAGIMRRANACSAKVLRTDPVDGSVVYLCCWVDGLGFNTFSELSQLSIHLEGVEQKNAEREEALWRSTWRPMTPEELHIQSLQAQLGGLGSAIYAYTKQLAGQRVIGRTTLVMAQADGRNRLQDLETWRADAIRKRLHVADELALLGKKPPRYAEYLAAEKALDTGGPNNGH